MPLDNKLRKFCDVFVFFARKPQRLKLSTSNLACTWGFIRARHKITARKKRAWSWVRELPKMWNFSFNIYGMAKASN